jgi:predicted GIY-YIG superfamily endonuclease
MASHKQWIESRLNRGISLLELKTSTQNILKSATNYSTKNDVLQKIQAIELYEKEFVLNTVKKPNSTNIYILKLENGKYYVGKSDNPMLRYQDHFNGNGSAWTRKYKPIGVEKIIPNASHFDEDKYTKEFMAKYGTDNVRGGVYVENELDEFTKENLNREIWGAENKCTRCGRTGHFVKDCYANTTVNGDRFDNSSDEDEDEDEDDNFYDSD